MSKKHDDDYDDILSFLYNTDFDGQPTKNENYARQLVEVHNEFVIRNKKLTSLLTDYIIQRKKRVKTNRFFKKFIFWFFIGISAVLTFSLIWFVAKFKPIYSKTGIISLVSAFITYLVSIISVFEIISKYLFPVDEEKDTISMIKTVIDNDINVENMMSKAIDKNGAQSIKLLNEFKKLLDNDIITQEEFQKLKTIEIDRLTKSHNKRQ